MASKFLALAGVSLFDPETALRSRRCETRRRQIEYVQSSISQRKGYEALSFEWLRFLGSGEIVLNGSAPMRTGAQ